MLGNYLGNCRLTGSRRNQASSVYVQVKALRGAPGRTRTADLEIRRLLLYPAELRGHVPAAGTGNA